jgi:hypothetical protein
MPCHNIKIIISSRLFAFSTFQSSNKFRTNFYLSFLCDLFRIFVFPPSLSRVCAGVCVCIYTHPSNTHWVYFDMFPIISLSCLQTLILSLRNDALAANRISIIFISTCRSLARRVHRHATRKGTEYLIELERISGSSTLRSSCCCSLKKEFLTSLNCRLTTHTLLHSSSSSSSSSWCRRRR